MYFKLWIVISVLILNLCLAQSFTGSFFIPSDAGGITLSMQEDTAGKITGALQGNGTSFTLEGELDTEEAGVSYGFIETPDGTLLFEAYLQEPQLYLYILETNAQGAIDYDNAQELLFERQAETPTASTANTSTAGTAATPPNQPNTNPLGKQQQNANPLAQQNPLTNDPFAGSYQGDGLSLILEPKDDQYSGQLETGGQIYPVVAMATTPTSLTGDFEVNGSTFSFTATLQDNQLILLSDGSRYALMKVAANPLQQATNPLEGNTDGASNTPNSPIIAQGQYASLTQADALAFISALEFSLQQVGYTYSFSEQERLQLLQGISQEFPKAKKEDQLVMSQAQVIWNNVQANWTQSTPQDQQTFVIGVFVLAFGEEAVQQQMQQSASQGSSGSGGLSCSTVDGCMSTLDPEGYNDMVAAQGCWAAAGCTDYDAGSDTYTYEDYSTPSFDSSGDF